MSRQKSTSRLKVIGLSRPVVLAGVIVCGIVAAVISIVLGSNVDRTVGIVGAVLAVTTFALSQWQTSGPRHRKIVMIPKSRSPFSTSVHRGLADAINEYPSISLSTEWPEEGVASEIEWQLSRLRAPDLLQMDGLVIVPAADDENLWSELVHISRAGLFIVVVDTKPENEFFAERQAPRPCFVGSNFCKGGDLLGLEISRLLSEVDGSRAVVALGPEWSWPGRERSRGIAHRLCVGGVAGKTTFLEIRDWNKERVADLLSTQTVEALRELRGGQDARLLVYCGNDKILAAVDRNLLRKVPGSEWFRIMLFGYDGALNSDGNFLIRGCEMGVATVDTQPELQGRTTAELLVDEHRGLLSGRHSRYIDPKLVIVPSMSSMGVTGSDD